jgi:predicted ABC-type ATPase
VSSRSSRSPEIIIIAGPNGAGKTTFAKQYLRQSETSYPFINADLVAAGLAPLAPDSVAILAGRLMLQEMERLVAARRSFAFETTLAGRGYATRLKHWRALGYRLKLLFLTLPCVEQALGRVRLRVSQGGHDIPPETIERRFKAGSRNFENLYRNLVDAWYVIDASNSYEVVASGGVNVEISGEDGAQ